MLKRLLRIALTGLALMGGYLGYVHGFELVADRVAVPHGVPVLEERLTPSASALESRRVALTAFGPGDWTIDANISLYEVSRGYFIYAKEYARLEDGKRIELWPFAVVWRDRKGKALKTLTADRATIVFDKPMDMMRGGGGARIAWGELKGGIILRDDKGTPGALGDDLVITGADGKELPYLTFSEKDNLIQTDQPILIRERDTTATADAGVKIILRPKAAPEPGVMPGYDGARTVTLVGHIWVHSQDVGRTGLVPGGAIRPEKAEEEKDEPRPGEITCDNGALIELPAPRVQPTVGPPAPEGPTFVHFYRNVQIRQGDAQEPEQINGDLLDLELRPAGRSNQTVDSEDGGPISNLAMRWAKVTGHAVWLQSKAQHVVGYGNELVYQKGHPDSPEGITFFRGVKEAQVTRENPEDGTVDVMRSFDITIFHDGPAGSVSSVVVGGPGWMQTRTKDDHTLLHAASWQSRAVLQPVSNDPKRRQLTLEGRPHVEDPLRGTLDSSQAIVAILASKPEPVEPGTEDEAVSKTRAEVDAAALAAAAPAADPSEDRRGPLAGGSYRIELMRAYRDAVLVSTGPIGGLGPEDGTSKTPGSTRTIRARDLLVVHFEEAAAPVVEAVGGPQEKDAPLAPLEGAVAAKPDPAPAEPEPQAEAKPDAEAAQAEPEPADPPLDVQADTIWAWVTMQPGDPKDQNKDEGTSEDPTRPKQKGDLREARLRGDVVIHQEKAPDGSRGFDVTGERVDLIGRGEKLFEVRAYAEPGQLAKVTTDTFSIEGGVLGLDQDSNYAVAIGPGRLIQQETGGNLLGDAVLGPPARAEGGENAKKEEKKSKGPMTITWGWDRDGRPLVDEEGRPVQTWMKFYGVTQGERGEVAPAQAEFVNGVRAWTSDSMLICDRLIADFDAPIDFRKARLAPGARGFNLRGDDPEAKGEDDSSGLPKLAQAHAHEDVRVLVRRLDEQGRMIEKQYIHGKEAHYDKLSNTFNVPSQGVVYLYTHRKPGQSGLIGGRSGDGRQVRPAAERKRAEAEDLGPLELTRVQFSEGMEGQLNTRQPGSSRQTGQAEFFGNVRTMQALVPGENADLSIDRPPVEFYYSVSDTLRIISEPPPPGADEDDPDRILVDAWDNIYARMGRPPSEESAITADDRMTYDSSTGLAIVYGGASGVTVVQTKGRGQDNPQFGSGDTVLYNHKTGQARLLNPRTLQILNPETGGRAEAPKPEKKEKKKEKRDPFPRVEPSDKERRNFTGR